MTSPSSRPDRIHRIHRVHRAVRRRVLARRRLLAALLAGVAVAAGVHTVAGPPPPTVAVQTAAHDLAAGEVVGADDLRVARLPLDAVPSGAEPDPVGRTLAGPLRAGEPVTDVRLVGPALAAAHPDLTTLPVRLPDPGLASLLRVGDRIDLIATDPQAGGSRVVAADALVLATPRPDPTAPVAGPPGAVVVVGVPPASVTTVTEAGVRWFLTYALSR